MKHSKFQMLYFFLDRLLIYLTVFKTTGARSVDSKFAPLRFSRCLVGAHSRVLLNDNSYVQ